MQWWVDEGRQTQCCRFASDEEVALDPEMYQCESCLVSAALNGLDAENRAAWARFQQVCSRFTVDTHAAGLVFERLTADLSVADYDDALARQSLIYDVYVPVRNTPDAS